MRTSSPSPGLAAHPKIPKETPRKSRYTSGPSYRSGTLTEAREAVILDVASIPEVSYEFFVNSVMPAPTATSSLDFAKIKATLLENDAIKGGRWSAFPKDPAKAPDKEDVVFAGLVSIKESITKATGLDGGNIFLQRPHKSPTLNRANKTRPDGCRLYSKGSPSDAHCRLSQGEKPVWRDGKVAWGDVVVVEEYKKGNGYKDVRDNRVKLIWGMHHVMRTDPCRRFVFGTSIENCEMRLWVFHRSHGMVTHAFNFITEHDKMIQLVLFLSYASSEGLGYDKTMRLIEANKYEVDVGSLTFVSSRILSDLAADRLCGRATRVFEVSEKSGSPQHFSLKDQWIDDDRLAEGSVLEDLRAMIKSETQKGLFDDMGLTRDPVDYFLSVKAYGHVHLSNNVEDNTKTIMQGLSLLDFSLSLSMPFSEKNFVSHNAPGINSESAGHIPYPTSISSILPLKRSDCHPRRHDRTVFNEVGTPLHNLDNLSDLFRGLADTTIALEIIHRLKCVHRDGTRQFTAVEIERGRYFFKERDGLKEIMNKREAAKLTNHLSSPKQPETLLDDTVLFNPLHDHESVWWIACWALLHYIPADDESLDGKLRERIEFARRIFHPTTFTPERYEVLSFGLPKSIIAHVPSKFEWLVDTVSIVRNTLCHRYKVAEADLRKIDEKAFDGIWQSIHAEYDNLAKHFEGLKVKMMDLKVEKRKLEDDDDSDMDDGHFLNKRGKVDLQSGDNLCTILIQVISIALDGYNYNYHSIFLFRRRRPIDYRQRVQKDLSEPSQELLKPVEFFDPFIHRCFHHSNSNVT